MKIQFLLLLETIEQNSTFREKALRLQFSSDEGPSLKMTSSGLLQVVKESKSSFDCTTYRWQRPSSRYFNLLVVQYVRGTGDTLLQKNFEMRGPSNGKTLHSSPGEISPTLPLDNFGTPDIWSEFNNFRCFKARIYRRGTNFSHFFVFFLITGNQNNFECFTKEII